MYMYVCMRMGERVRKYEYNCACSNFIEFISHSHALGYAYSEEYNILILLLNQFVQLNRYLMESVEIILHIIDCYVVL